MSREITFFETIRGVEVEVIAEDFDGDESVGIPIGPECVWAVTLDGEAFELTDEEVERLGIEATKIYFEDTD